MHFREVVRAQGHQNIRATHRSTLEFTSDSYLTTRGDCILGILIDRDMRDFSPSFKETLRSGWVVVFITVNGLTDYIIAEGSPNLTMDGKGKIIIRKSEYTDPFTLAVRSNKAAKDIDRGLIKRLRGGDVFTLNLIATNEKPKDIEVFRELIDTNAGVSKNTL